jgi:hypothetical protein
MNGRLAVATLGVAVTLVQSATAAAQSAVQRPTPPRSASASHAITGITATAPAPNTSGAFVIEAVGGSLGSLAGMGLLVALTKACDTDDLACVITKVGAGGAIGVAGATVGTTFAARHTGSDRSVLGAALGGVVGTGAGLGIHWLLNRGTANNLGDWIVVPIFTLSQGTFAAAGSRLLGR